MTLNIEVNKATPFKYTHDQLADRLPDAYISVPIVDSENNAAWELTLAKIGTEYILSIFDNNKNMIQSNFGATGTSYRAGRPDGENYVTAESEKHPLITSIENSGILGALVAKVEKVDGFGDEKFRVYKPVNGTLMFSDSNHRTFSDSHYLPKKDFPDGFNSGNGAA